MTSIHQSAPAGLPRTLSEAARVFYAHASPRILTALVVVAAGGRVLLGSPRLGDLVVAAVVLTFWPLQEWLIHVFILHHRPRTFWGRTIDYAVARKHRAHHRDPWRPELIFIPLGVYLYSPLVIFGFFALATPSPALAFTGAAVYFLLSLHYEWVHLLVHTNVRPKGAYYQRLVRNHRLHHFKNEHYWFGVTRLRGDHLLRTHPDVAAVETSETCRDLLAAGVSELD